MTARYRHGSRVVDLQSAQILRAKLTSDFNPVSFHCQQAVEKLLKAAWIARGVQKPPKVHDLVRLSELVTVAVPGWKWEDHELSDLSSAAAEGRYPRFVASAEEADPMLHISVSIWNALRPLI